MKERELAEVAAGRRGLTPPERRWCVAALRGPLAEWNPLPRTSEADDAVLATCVLRAWTLGWRCDCA